MHICLLPFSGPSGSSRPCFGCNLPCPATTLGGKLATARGDTTVEVEKPVGRLRVIRMLTTLGFSPAAVLA